MVEFKSNNGKKGVERVSRTPTGYRMFVYNPGNPKPHLLEEDGMEMILGRGVEEDGRPYIEIEFANMKQSESRDILTTLLVKACEQKNLKASEALSAHGNKHLCFHVMHNCLTDVFEALLLIMLPNGQPLIPDAGRIFIGEQQTVRHGLEQSLLNAFGQDMYARPMPSNRTKTKYGTLPKSEVNRIARLVNYFRNGVPEMKKLTNVTI